jgi:Zn-finger nucleic acid-binding protein
MKCPIDDSDLQMTERQGVEIDYCPKCRGIWLDRGELDKIIERSEKDGGYATTNPPPTSYPPDQNYGYGGGHHGNKRRKSWIGELFD